MAENTQYDRNDRNEQRSVQFERQNTFDRSNQIERDWQQASNEFRRTAEEERNRSERLANRLSREALQQWQRSVDGLLALPTAAALGLASSSLYVAAFIERGFEIVQQSTESLRLSFEQSRRDLERYDGDARLENGNRRVRGELQGGQQGGQVRGNLEVRGDVQQHADA